MFITIIRLTDSITYPFLFSLNLSTPPHSKTVCVCVFPPKTHTSSCDERPTFSSKITSPLLSWMNKRKERNVEQEEEESVHSVGSSEQLVLCR